MGKTLIIAEAGVNHNGDLQIAKQLIDVAAAAGVDFVKFQTFKAEKLVSAEAKQAAYQQKNLGGQQDDSQFTMLKKLELDVEAHHELIDYCASKNIRFFSTAFDLESIDVLNQMDFEYFKIPSGEITNKPYLQKIGSLGKKVILSTGMSNLGEIEAALNLLVEAGTPKSDIIILHCNTEYPTPMADVNLRAMNTIGQAFEVPIGYSDHTLGIEVPIAAVARGAVCIEKHFTLDRNMEGPDHKASLEPAELTAMVKAIRNIELALGSPIKQPSPSEAKNIPIARKSIHLAKNLPEGHTLKMEDLIMKRPGKGISPMLYDQIVGRKLRVAKTRDSLLQMEELI